MRLRLNDGGYPAGVHAGTPEAPWNRDAECWQCDLCGESEDDVERAQGTDYCQLCAAKRGLRQCAACQTWGGEGTVLLQSAKDEWLCVACGAKEDLAPCQGCGLLCADAKPHRSGETLCNDCAADVDHAEANIREAMDPPAVHPIFADILRAHFGEAMR
jgi:hypothetical protein